MPLVIHLRPAPAALLLLAVACGGGDQPPADAAPPPPPAAELTAFQLEHGIGPVTEAVELGSYDPALAATGDTVFTAKCTACHKFEERYVGPALGGVTERRSAAFVMNMILNPQEMYERHPEGKALLAQYLTYMPNQGLTREDARAVVEYLRGAGGTTP